MEEARRRERERQGKQPLLVAIVDGIKQTFTDVRPKVGRLCEDLRAKGAHTKVGEFSGDLFRPMHRIRTVSLEGFAKELKGTVKLDPQQPMMGFVIWNALAFWFGVAETLASLIFGTPMLNAVLNIVTGFCIAYFLFWIFIYSNDKWYMRNALIFGVCLAIYYGFSAFGNLIWVLPAILYACKAVATAIMCMNGWKLLKAADEPSAMPENAASLARSLF